jgi:phage shock protein E
LLISCQRCVIEKDDDETSEKNRSSEAFYSLRFNDRGHSLLNKQKIVATAILLAIFLTLAACGPVVAPEVENGQTVITEYIRITAAEAKNMIDNEAVTIVDVRTQEEYDEVHIAGSILIPDTSIEKLAPGLLTDKNATILVYCRSGRRSEIASKKLIEMGYLKVYDFGGIIDWPYETVSN